MTIWNKVTGMCNKKEESEESSSGAVELNMVTSPSNDAALDLKSKNSKLVAALEEARTKADYAVSVQDISAIASAVSKLLAAQEAMAEVQMAQAGVNTASKGSKI